MIWIIIISIILIAAAINLDEPVKFHPCVQHDYKFLSHGVLAAIAAGSLQYDHRECRRCGNLQVAERGYWVDVKKEKHSV